MSDGPHGPAGASSGPLPIPELAGVESRHGFTNRVVHAFLHSNLSLVLILLSAAVGLAALSVTPREEDPQIVVPLADVFVSYPGHTAAEVEQHVTNPLEKLLYQIDGVEYVYSMSKPGASIITVRFLVGQDRERSLVKLKKKIDENLDLVPPGVAGWVVKPVEIDDVPIVTLTLRGGRGDSFALRRVAEELGHRLSTLADISRISVTGGDPRRVLVRPDPRQLESYGVSLLDLQRALAPANALLTAGRFQRQDESLEVEVGQVAGNAAEVRDLVVAVHGDRPVFVKDVATVQDGPDEISNYVRHRWGPARDFDGRAHAAGTLIGGPATAPADSQAAVTIALAKKKGTNAVRVSEQILEQAGRWRGELIPDDMELVVTRNAGLTADEKVDELVEALLIAVVIVVALLTLSMGWREAFVVAVAVPVVFGLTLAVNLLLGFSINRVTLFALILSLGLLCDDPIVDVENIARHFALRKKASRRIVQEAVAEIRPPLIAATLAVILSFIPMFFITGMMGPYMQPMALNVPVTMVMSMVVAFTITPWLAYHMLRHHTSAPGPSGAGSAAPEPAASAAENDLETLRRGFLWRLFYPLMAPLLRSRLAAWTFLAVIALLTVLATGLAATRHVPLKMLPFDNKNELLLVLDFDEGTTLEHTDAAVREVERYLARVPEVTDVTAYVGLASPMDFNGLVRHYYLRRGDHLAEVRVNLTGKKSRAAQSHALGLRLRDDLTALAARRGGLLKIVETPPGPPVIATLVAEVYGQSHHRYDELAQAAGAVAQRLRREPGVVEVEDTLEAPQKRWRFQVDQEKAALHGASVEEIARTVQAGLEGAVAGLVRDEQERNPLLIQVRLPRHLRSSLDDLGRIPVRGRDGQMAPLAELGRWTPGRVDQTIYHKNGRRVVYVFAETAGRAPAEAIVDVKADRIPPWEVDQRLRDAAAQRVTEGSSDPASTGAAAAATQPGGNLGAANGNGPAGNGWVEPRAARPLAGRTFLSNGSQVYWGVPAGFEIEFAGEGEWKITLDVFRDLGLAFAAAMVAIYVLLVAQTRSFTIPVVVMLAIPLTLLGVMPGFWLLNVLSGGQVGAYPDPVFFTATGMIGMIALAGIVTRDSIILVDFIHLSLRRGRSLFDAIMESRVVRLRPILLTTATAMLGAVPITIDPIFSGLAWALIFGLLASTVFTLFVIPVAYWLLYAHKPGHGLPVEDETETPAAGHQS